MGKEILIFGDIEIEKKNINSRKSYFLKDVDIEKVLVSNKILSWGKTVNTLLVTSIMIIQMDGSVI